MRKTQGIAAAAAALALGAGACWAQPVTYTLSNNIAGDGQLIVHTDAFGAVTNWSYLPPANSDDFDPAGSLGLSNPSFASSFFLYSGGIDRCSFADPSSDISLQYPGSLFHTPVGTPILSDSDGDGVDDTLESEWDSTNFIDLTLNFKLKQTVHKPAAGQDWPMWTQTLTITNNGQGAVTIELHRHLDLDLLWDGAAEDVVGSVDNGGVGIPYMREAEPFAGPTTDGVVFLTGTQPYSYTAAKSGLQDPTAPQPYAYGTDFQMWNNFGKFPEYDNHTAGIGYYPNVGEVTGRQPAGSVTPWDCYINISWDLEIAAGASTVVDVVHGYGDNGSEYGAGGCPACACAFDGNAADCTLFDFIEFQNQFLARDPCACGYDGNPNDCTLFDFIEFQNQFLAGPCP